jgi:hypothetical protein
MDKGKHVVGGTRGSVRRIGILVAAIMLFMTAAGPAVGAPADRSTSPVFDFATEQEIPGAEARMVRTNSGVNYYISTSGLEKGHTYTIWWVIFNNPDACDKADPEEDFCAIGDLFVDFPNDLTPNPEVNPAVMAGSGHVVGASGKGKFASHLREGQITSEHPLFVGGPGLLDARGAEIHLVVRSHGPLNPAAMPEQIKTFAGGCEVNLPAGMVPEELGECADVQFTVFK